MTTTTTTTSNKASARPWVERYRPQNLNQVSHQPEVVATLQNAVETGRLPHLLLYGPPGSGKTSVALALCRQLWSPNEWRRRVLELNASDERGISVVRDKIKHFAALRVGQASNSNSSKRHLFGKEDQENDTTTTATKEYPNPPYKIIILDEADTVTPDAQAALRRIIEAYSKITRFVLICNYVTRIIEPLASRCAKFRFQALPVESMKGRLQEIATLEHAHHVTEQHLDQILETSQGDMRRAVTTLQSVHSLGSEHDNGKNSTSDAIAEMAGLPPPSVVTSLWKSLLQPSFDVMRERVEEILAEGYSAQLLLQALLPLLTAAESPEEMPLTELGKANVAMAMAQAEHAMAQGADEGLQLLAVGSTTVQCFVQSQQELAVAKQ